MVIETCGFANQATMQEALVSSASTRSLKSPTRSARRLLRQRLSKSTSRDPCYWNPWILEMHQIYESLISVNGSWWPQSSLYRFMSTERHTCEYAAQLSTSTSSTTPLGIWATTAYKRKKHKIIDKPSIMNMKRWNRMGAALYLIKVIITHLTRKVISIMNS